MQKLTKDSLTQLRFIAIMAISTLLLLYITAAILAWWGYGETRENADRQLTNIGLLLAEETARSIDGVRVAVDGIANDIAQVEDGQINGKWVSSNDILSALNRIVSLLPPLSRVIVSMEDGRLIHSGPPGNHRDIETIRGLSQVEDSLNVFVYENNPQAILAVMRQITDRNGQYLGYVAGIIPTSYFHETYRSLEIDNGGEIILWWEDGTALASHPLDVRIGERDDIVSNALNQELPVQMLEGSNIMSDFPRTRIMSLQTIRGYPLAVSTSFLKDTIFHGWWRSLLFLIAGCVLLTLLVNLLVIAVKREFSNVKTLRQLDQQRQDAVKEHEKISEQLRQSQKLEVIGQLTAGIAHDFNNLLTVVIGNLDILMKRAEKLEGNENTLRLADAAMTGAKKAATLTHRLLAFARKQPLTPKSILIQEKIQGVVELLKRTIGDDIKITIDCPADIWPVFVDISQLENALVNLVVNARDAMPNGGQVTISAQNSRVDKNTSTSSPDLIGDFVAITVSDTGEGMPPEILEKAFEPFFSTKEVGKGSGLGLSQIYGFAHQSGGDCSIDSTVGEGTCVTIRIPKSEITPDDEDVKEPIQEAAV